VFRRILFGTFDVPGFFEFERAVFLTIRTNVLTLTRRAKTSVGMERPSTGHEEEGIEEEEEDA
jgi:hypothetical protein